MAEHPLHKMGSSTRLLTNPKLDVTSEEAAKILFLSTDPQHELHGVAGLFGEDSCYMCRLIGRIAEAINKKKVRILRTEIEKKIIKFSKQDESNISGLSSLDTNLSRIGNKLVKQHEEILTFCEVLNIMNLPVPNIIKQNYEAVLLKNSVPVQRKVSEANTTGEKDVQQVNTFLSYTSNKILQDVCEQLSSAHVYRLYKTILEKKMFDKDVRDSMLKLQLSEEEDPTYKDLLFYYIVLNLQKYSLLSRLHTHVLYKLIEESNTTGVDIKFLKSLDVYPLTPNPPGVCIIFAMIEGREEGTKKDIKNLKSTFKDEFNFDVHVKTDPRKADFKHYASELNAGRYMFYDSLVVIFLGHGTKSYLQVQDGFLHRRTDFIQPFAEMSWLQKKPKLFFIQACAVRNPRTAKTQMPAVKESGVGMNTEVDSFAFGITKDRKWSNDYGEHCDGEVINSLADTLISYATMWYEEAARNELGSPYINTLLESLKAHGRTESIEDVLRSVHYKVNTVRLAKKNGYDIWKQTPYYESALQKKFIFPKKM